MPSALLLNQINKICEIKLLVKTTFHLHKARICPTGLGATFSTVLVLIYWLREFLCLQSLIPLNRGRTAAVIALRKLSLFFKNVSRQLT